MKRSRVPLSGCRIVEMAHHLSAPLAAMSLADFGADAQSVLAETGYRRGDIARLIGAEVVQPPPPTRSAGAVRPR